MPSPLKVTLEKHGLGGVFYLHGEDEFRKREATAQLVEAHLDPATADFNLDRLSGSEVDVETLASVIATPPMMATWRVVVLRETEALAASKTARELLVEVARDPPTGLALVLACTVPSGSRAKFYRDLAKHARSIAFPTIPENDVPLWAVEHARSEHGVEMDDGAARALAAAVGTDLGVLAQEIDKLVGFVGEGSAIDEDAVAKAGTRLPAEDRWRWFDRVGSRRFGEALETLPTLLGQRGESGVGLVIGLSTHLLRLGVVCRSGLEGLEKTLPGRQAWLVRSRGGDLKRQARAWGAPELEAALQGLLRTDRLLKSTSLGEEGLLEEWLLTELARLEAGGRGDERAA